MRLTVFLGAPGSGKGTQAKRLAAERGYIHLSTGDMLREAIRLGSDLGKSAQAYMDRGELVADTVMIGLIEDTLSGLHPSAHVILDGFPRTVPQAQALDGGKRTHVDTVVFFRMVDDKLVARLTGRRICKGCGESFHILFMPPKKEGICDKCQGTLFQRADDSASVVKKRLSVYENQTAPLLDYYGSTRKLSRLDADKNVDLVQKELSDLLGNGLG